MLKIPMLTLLLSLMFGLFARPQFIAVANGVERAQLAISYVSYPIYGTLSKDGAVAPGVQVMLTNERTSESLSDTTDPSGDFSVDLSNYPSGYVLYDTIDLSLSIKGVESVSVCKLIVDNMTHKIDPSLITIDYPFDDWWVGNITWTRNETVNWTFPLYQNPPVTNPKGLVYFYGYIKFEDQRTQSPMDKRRHKLCYGLSVTGPTSDSSEYTEYYYTPYSKGPTLLQVPINPPSDPPATEYYDASMYLHGYDDWYGDESLWMGGLNPELVFYDIPTLVTHSGESVGGIVIPVDKVALLAPYIGLTSTIIAATVATSIYVKRAKHRKEKQ